LTVSDLYAKAYAPVTLFFIFSNCRLFLSFLKAEYRVFSSPSRLFSLTTFWPPCFSRLEVVRIHSAAAKGSGCSVLPSHGRSFQLLPLLPFLVARRSLSTFPRGQGSFSFCFSRITCFLQGLRFSKVFPFSFRTLFFKLDSSVYSGCLSALPPVRFSFSLCCLPFIYQRTLLVFFSSTMMSFLFCLACFAYSAAILVLLKAFFLHDFRPRTVPLSPQSGAWILLLVFSSTTYFVSWPDKNPRPLFAL